MSDLTTLANVKEWLGIPPATTTNDALLTRMIGAASDYIQTWLNRTFAIGPYSEVRDGSGGDRFMFGNYPVSTVSSVKVDWLSVPASPGNGMPGYVFDGTTLTLLGGYRFSRAKSNVQVDYTAGFATTPKEVEQACIELVGLRYREMDRIGMVSKTLAGETITFTQKDFSDSIETTLTNYKKVIPV